MSTWSNAQAALQVAERYTAAGFPSMVLDRADQFKSWLDEADAKDKQTAQAELEDAWNKGHESGFWNGRESAGNVEMKLVGVEHAKVNNPHTARVPDEGVSK